MFDWGTLALLWIIRDHGPLTARQLLLRILGQTAVESGTADIYSRLGLELFGTFVASDLSNDDINKNLDWLYAFMGRVLQPLVDAKLVKLVEADVEGGTRLRDETELSVTEALRRVQDVFGIHLADYIRLTDDPIVVSPLFGAPSKNSDLVADVFVMMPFREHLQPVYTDHIQPVATGLGLSCRRGDDFFSHQAIIDDIWAAIFHARACIADCTGRNPNVFYEIGMAHSLGRPVILIAQSAEDIPFDVKHLRYIIYEYTPRGMKEFEENLRETLDWAVRRLF